MRQWGPLLVALCVTFFHLVCTPAEAAATKTVQKRYFCTPAAKRDTGNDPFSSSSNNDVTNSTAERHQPMCFTTLFACLLVTKNSTACVMKSPADVDPYWDSGKRDVSAVALPYDVNKTGSNPKSEAKPLNMLT